MKDLVKAFDNLPWIAKLILAFPFIGGFAWGIYRLIKGLDRNNMTLIIAGIVWIFVGWAILWIVDLISIIMYGKIVVFAN